MRTLSNLLPTQRTTLQGASSTTLSGSHRPYRISWPWEAAIWIRDSQNNARLPSAGGERSSLAVLGAVAPTWAREAPAAFHDAALSAQSRLTCGGYMESMEAYPSVRLVRSLPQLTACVLQRLRDVTEGSPVRFEMMCNANLAAGRTMVSPESKSSRIQERRASEGHANSSSLEGIGRAMTEDREVSW